jgi:hypothetical protein
MLIKKLGEEKNNNEEKERKEENKFKFKRLKFRKL